MATKRISERKIILYTAALVVLAGIVRFLHYPTGSVLFYIAFLPFILYRLYSIVKYRKYRKESLEMYMIIILAIMILSTVMNIAGWQEADFFLLFLLMIDYLLVINKRF
ncbi:MAG TPA: hypothetical protein PKL52_07465 [Tenuifilaceae bacterium]|nr:hypothetical protein [Tenuifilaceae bacterium]